MPHAHHPAFITPPTTIHHPSGMTLQIGIVDPYFENVSERISELLFASISGGKASLGGHLPDHIVEDVKNQYITPGKVRTLWNPCGYRFAIYKIEE